MFIIQEKNFKFFLCYSLFYERVNLNIILAELNTSVNNELIITNEKILLL